MVKSKTVDKLFYYNTKTKIGQFECPSDIVNLAEEAAPQKVAALIKDADEEVKIYFIFVYWYLMFVLHWAELCWR